MKHLLASRFLAVLILVLSFGSYAQESPRFAEPLDAVVRVLELTEQRLALMDDVAAWKWQAQRPIADLERERRVVDAMAQRAQQLGLDATATRGFFQFQIDLARRAQVKRFDEWRAAGFDNTRTIPDLEKSVRPQLDAIGAQLLQALYLAAPTLAVPHDHARVREVYQRLAKLPGMDTSIETTLRNLLSKFKPAAAGNLAAIRTTKILRVGTTGDYAPFSFDVTDEQHSGLVGLDIQLALALAKHLKVEPYFVRTSWPNLMSDLQAGRFDIAASGISVTPERATQADFSLPYHHDGKTPIARCIVKERFTSIAAINQPAVRVVVNPGGTNERFAREHFSLAQLRVHADNRTVFDEIVAERADVMVTDAIEVELQTRLYPDLCRTTSAIFSEARKAMLFPKHASLTTIANDWLRQQIANDTVRLELDKALQTKR